MRAGLVQGAEMSFNQLTFDFSDTEKIELKDKEQKTIMKTKGASRAGLCSEERSMISSDYARNFICDFILGKYQADIMGQTLFDFDDLY